MKRCFGCMGEYEEHLNECPHCKYKEGTGVKLDRNIPPGSILKGENATYTVGRVIGSGTFGITYIAWDNLLERKVAIKEYMPNEYTSRVSASTLVKIDNEEAGTFFSKGMEKFIEEARKLAKFENEKGIVRIFDHFYQNNTAYIVTEYLEGMTLGEFIEKYGTIKPDKAVNMLMPIMKSLINVNKAGIIHRDIAPDNIMITNDGQIKLIDFGAARFRACSSSSSITVVIKEGYSPEEQYSRNGQLGSYTDVYSMAATLYKMITGITPPGALKRRVALKQEKKNIVVPIRKSNRKIPRTIENAIYNAMHIQMEDRTKDFEQFIAELSSKKAVKLRDQTIGFVQRLSWKPWQIVTAALSSVIVITSIILLSTGVIHFDSKFEEEFTMPEGMTRVPTLINKEMSKGMEMLNEANLLYRIMGKTQYNAVPKDKIYKQSIDSGMITDVNTVVEIWISGGPQMLEVPNVLGMMEEKALEELQKKGIASEIVYTYNTAPKGSVIAISKEAGSEISKGSKLQITVSEGQDPDIEVIVDDVTVKDFIGMDYETAIQFAREHNLQLIVEGRKFSDEYEKNEIISQSIESGTSIKSTEPIFVWVSDGEEIYEMPDIVYETEEAARQKLSDIKANVEVRYETHETIAKGVVISQGTEKGVAVRPGETITIVVSEGQGTFNMPEVKGKDERTAKSELQGLGLKVVCSYEYSDKVASGKVISQSVSKGADVSSGKSVALVISIGKEEKLFEVPDVVGKTKAEAIKLLENKEYVVSTTEAYSDNINKGAVMSQSLEAGTKYKENTKIVIVISKGKEPFRLSYDGNGGTVAGDAITVYYGEQYGTLAECKRSGYTFAGWYTAGGDKVTGSTVHAIKSDITLYAHWKAEVYTVTFKGNGGADKGTIKVTYNSTYGTLPTNSRDNYSFDGWYTASEGGTKITSATKVTITGNQTLYAHWTRGKLSVTYNANGGTVDASCILYNQGDTYYMPIPKLDYHRFEGWYTEPSGGTKVSSGDIVTKSGNQTLYAHWTKKGEVSWTLKSSVPSGAMITNTKYTYTLTETNTTGIAPAGYTQVNKVKTGETLIKSVEADYVTDTYGLNLNDANIAKFNVSPPTEYKNDTGYSVCTTRHSGYYLYWHWCKNCDHRYNYNRDMCDEWTSEFHTFHWHTYGNLDTLNDNGIICYKRLDRNICVDTQWWHRKDLYKYTYYEYAYVYTYTYTKSAESTSYPSGSNVSDVKEYVKYIPK